MIDDLLRKIEEGLKEFFADHMLNSLGNLTKDINDTVGNIGTEVAKSPQDWNSGVFNLIKNLSDTVILPLAGIVITYVLVYELYQMVVEKNNFKQFEVADMLKYIFKAFIAVLALSHTFDIVMAIFDVGGHVVRGAVSTINSGTGAITLGDYSAMKAQLMGMPLYEVVGMWAETLFIQMMMYVISLVIMVILYGRMIELYLSLSVAPLAFSALGNKELSSMSHNYIKSLLSIAFQGFFIMVTVGIYAQLVSAINAGAELHATLINVAISTLVLLFVLLKSGSISKSIFGAH